MSTTSENSSSANYYSPEKRPKIQTRIPVDVSNKDEKNKMSNEKQDMNNSTNKISSKTNLRQASLLKDKKGNVDSVLELYKITPSKELKCFDEEISSEAIKTVDVNELSEREQLEEELRRVDFLIRNRKQSLLELETYRRNQSLTASQDNEGSNENSATSVTFSSSSCESECEREVESPKNSERNFLSNLRQMMPSFHLIGDIDQRLAQLNVKTSQNLPNGESAQCDLALQALDVLTKRGIHSSTLSSPYPITEYLFEANNN